MLLALGAASSVAAAESRWPDLAVLEVARSCADEPIEIRYDPKLATVDNTVVTDPETGSKAVRALKARVVAGGPELLVDYWEGMSCDPTFALFAAAAGRESKPVLDEFGLGLAIPGDGYVYLYGHTNSYYDQLRKFAATGAGFEEVAQPFHHVGRATKARVPLKLLAAPESLVVVATLVPGDVATVDVCRKDDWCVVADAAGVAGWLKLEYVEGGQLEGFHFAGD